jgi:TRAP-type mannitol/chloroaromatic compound transport system permease small subunit
MHEHSGGSIPNRPAGAASGRARNAWVARVVAAIDSLAVWNGKIFAWLIIPLVAGLVYEVFSRYLFNAPTLWAFDVTYMLYGALFMLTASFTLYRKGHVRTDIFYRLLSDRWQAIIDGILYLVLFFPGMILFFLASWDYFYLSWVTGEQASLTAWRPPMYPFKGVIPLTALLLIIQGISEFIKCVEAAMEGRWR